MTTTGFQFKPDIKVSILTVILLPVMMSLGFWQLDRAEEKAKIQAEFDARRVAAAVNLSQLPPVDSPQQWNYYRVVAEGVYLNRKTWLLDNRMFQGKVGYEVITPFVIDDGRILMVNRGWLAGDPGRRYLPEIPAVEGRQRIEGEVYLPSSRPFMLAEDQLSDQWPQVIQQLNFELFEQSLAKGENELFPASIRVREPGAGALTDNWLIVNITPEKHTGYAVQWFSMSAALVIIFILLSTNLKQLLNRAK